MGFTSSGDESGSERTPPRNRTAGRSNLEADHDFVNWLDFIQSGSSIKVATEKHSITMSYYLLPPPRRKAIGFFYILMKHSLTHATAQVICFSKASLSAE